MEHNILNFFQKFQQPESFDSNFAILILNQPILCEPQLIKSLWNKAAVRALVDGGTNRWLEFLQKFGDLKLPDFFSGDFDSISPESKAYFEGHKVKSISTPDQDETDFTKALRCLADLLIENQLNVKMVLAICENSGRFDQVIGNINTLLISNQILQNILVVLVSSQNITCILRSGEITIRVGEEFVKEQFSCGLIPFCGPTIVTTSGLKWNLKDQTMEMGGLISTSNTFSCNEISVSCNKDLVWTTQYSKNEQ